MEILAARDLIPETPAGVEALRVLERAGEGPTVRLCAAGDVGFSGRLTALAGSGSALAEISPVVRGADLTFANLETPLAAGGGLFAAPPAAVSDLAGAGWKLLNLANNHVLDHGAEGLATTRRALADAGVEVLGAGAGPDGARRLVTVAAGGLRVGWLGCARTLKARDDGARETFWEYDFEELLAAVRAARERVDVVAVSIHMGYMYVDYPHPKHRREALALVDAGAGLVVLHHAHVVQGIEATPRGVVCYSLGNLLIDWTEGELVVEESFAAQRSGGLFVFDLDRRGVRRLAVLPTRVDDGLRVRWTRGEEGRRALERLRRLSVWDRDTAPLFHRQLAERVAGHALRSTFAELRRGGPRAFLSLAARVRLLHVRMLLGWLAGRLGLRRRAGSREPGEAGRG